MLRRYRWRFASGAALLLATNGMALLIPLVMREAVESLRHAPAAATMGWYALLMGALASGQAVARTTSRVAVLGPAAASPSICATGSSPTCSACRPRSTPAPPPAIS